MTRTMPRAAFCVGRPVVCAVLALSVAVLPPGPVRATPLAESEPTPLDVVVAVDESGSLKPGDVRREIEAATTIGQSGLNPRTRVGVLGFGGATGRGQRVVHLYCPLAGAGSPGELQKLADCTRQIHRRTPAEGDDTDHVAALRAALATLRTGSQRNALKTVFLMTDGKLDVSRSPIYGRRPGGRAAAAEGRLRQQLDLAQRGDVQIWPLGFGPEVDRSALDRFAFGGSRRACDARQDSQPHAQVVKDSREVARALITAYAAASCFKVTPTEERRLDPGGTIELPQRIPGYASDATLTVAKGNPLVRADFITPDGQVVDANGTSNGSTYTRSGGSGGTVEALRVTNPLNGTWKVRLTAPSGISAEQAAATALYQGAIRPRLTVEPGTILTGRPITARLSVQTRREPLTPQELRSLTFRVTARTPDGRHNVPMRDDGRPPDRRAGDGEYSGTLTAPASSGKVTFTGTVEGQGLRQDSLPTRTVEVAEPPGWVERNLWWLLSAAAVAVLTLVAALLIRDRRRAARDVRDLRLTLRHNGGDPRRELRPSQPGRIEEFRFAIRDLDWGVPRLDHARQGDKAYKLRRTANRQIELEQPDGRVVGVTAHTPVDLGDGLRLTVADASRPARRALARWRPLAPRGGVRSTTDAPAPTPPPPPQEESPTFAFNDGLNDDELLL